MTNRVNQESFITIGKILTTHGNKGELKIMPLTDFPDRFTPGLQVYLEEAGKLETYKISSVRNHNKWLILKLDEIADMSSAEKLRNSLIKVPLDEAMPLPEGSYYVFQLIGIPVYDEDENYLGEIKDIFQTGSNDVYQIIHPKTQQEILLPAIKDCVKAINITEQKIIVRLLPGLLD